MYQQVEPHWESPRKTIGNIIVEFTMIVAEA